VGERTEGEAEGSRWKVQKGGREMVVLRLEEEARGQGGPQTCRGEAGGGIEDRVCQWSRERREVTVEVAGVAGVRVQVGGGDGGGQERCTGSYRLYRLAVTDLEEVMVEGKGGALAVTDWQLPALAGTGSRSEVEGLRTGVEQEGVCKREM
jgi:hypothetical protein